MAKLEIPIPVKVDIYKIEELIDRLKHLQTYKLFAGDEMTLVDRDEVVEIIADHVKAEVSSPDQRQREERKMTDPIERQQVLEFLADLQYGISPNDNDSQREREKKKYAYKVLEWVYEQIQGIK